MARSNGISALMAAPLCAAALLSAPARAEDSLFVKANQPSVEAPAPKPDAAKKPVAKKHVAKHKPASQPKEADVAPAALPPVVVQEAAPEPQSAFGQQMPQQSLINRFMNPANASAAPSAQGGKAVEPAEPEEETLPNGMPKKFLLNRLFDSSALEPAQPDPRNFMAQAQQSQAPEPSLFDRATSALGLGDKTEPAAGNLPPVTVTAPAKPAKPGKPDRKLGTAAPTPAPVASPPPPAPAPAPAPSGWFDRATGAIGLGGGGDESIPDYSERPKIAVPQNRDALPPPRPVDERRVQRPPTAEALTRPPAGFTEKVQGADGKVSGFTEQDEGKKGWFNWF